MKNTQLSYYQKANLTTMLEQSITDHIQYSLEQVGAEMVMSYALTKEIIDTSYAIRFCSQNFFYPDTLQHIELSYEGQTYSEVLDLWEIYYNTDAFQEQLIRFTQMTFLDEVLTLGYKATITLTK